MKRSKNTAAKFLPLFVVIFVSAAILITIAAIQWKKTEAMRFVNNLGAGINIGNSLDSTGLREYHPDAGDLEYETYWGNPEITAELFSMIKEGGFSTVRIPVTWQDHMDENGNISEPWMRRVQEVVDMALEQDLYVILNTHHEEWLDLDIHKKDEIAERFSIVWNQIGQQFASYDERLMFEAMNEPRLRESEVEWKAGTPQMRDMVNQLNQIFVDTVRAAGENNRNRYLLVCPYATNHMLEAMEALDVPEGNIIVSIHMYSPYTFCQDEDGMVIWDPEEPECREYEEEMKMHFKNMQELFLEKNIPVMITEFGCTDKDNLDSRMKWLEFYRSQADTMGIPCIWWDNGSGYQIMDREKYVWTYPEIKNELVK